jgi:hypothetical protein
MSIASPRHRTNWRAVRTATGLLFLSSSIAFIGVLIVLYFWFLGGRFTIDGTAQLVGGLASMIGAPWSLLPPLPWHLYLQALPIPIAASGVEFGVPVVIAAFGMPRRFVWALWIVWALVSGLDLYTTFAGTGIADATSHPFRQFLASNPPARGGVTFALTFGPEALLSALVYIVQQAWRGWLDSWRQYDTGSRSVVA